MDEFPMDQLGDLVPFSILPEISMWRGAGTTTEKGHVKRTTAGSASEASS